MPNERLSLVKILEVLRLKFEAGLSNRQIARSLNLCHATVAQYLHRAEAAGVGWPLPESVSPIELERRLFRQLERRVDWCLSRQLSSKSYPPIVSWDDGSSSSALVLKPRVLLLDESFGALDPGIRADMHELILGLWRDTGMLILMVTHDIREGFELGTRLLVFDRVRLDRHAPGAYGATVTYDIPLDRSRPARLMAEIGDATARTERFGVAVRQ